MKMKCVSSTNNYERILWYRQKIPDPHDIGFFENNFHIQLSKL